MAAGQTILSSGITGETNPGLFAVAPHLGGVSGNDLLFTVNTGVTGLSTVTITTVDSGPSGPGANGGVNQNTGTQTFTIQVGVNQPPTFDLVGNIPSPPAAPGTVQVLQASGTTTIVDFLRNLSSGPANDVPAGQVIQSLTIVAANPSAFLSQPTLVLLAGDPTQPDLQFTLNPAFAGTAQVIVTAVDNGGTAFGGQNTTAKTFTIVVIDTTPPLAPSAPVLDPLSDGGTKGDNLTNDNTPTYDGTAEPGSTVNLFVNGGATSVGSGVTDGTGHYAVTVTNPLADSPPTYVFTATATDAANNVSPISGPSAALTIDTVPPTAPGKPVLDPSTDSGVLGDNITSNTTPKFTGTAPANVTVSLFAGTTQIGTTTSTAGGTWSITSSVLAAGTYSITAQTFDTAGNAGISPALTVTIDNVAPTSSVPDLDPTTDTGTSSTDNITKLNNGLKFNGTVGAGDAGSTVQLFDNTSPNPTLLGTATLTGTSWTFTTTTVLADGVHNIFAKVTDPASNVGQTATLAVTVDSTAPVGAGDCLGHARYRRGRFPYDGHIGDRQRHDLGVRGRIDDPVVRWCEPGRHSANGQCDGHRRFLAVGIGRRLDASVDGHYDRRCRQHGCDFRDQEFGDRHHGADGSSDHQLQPQ